MRDNDIIELFFARDEAAIAATDKSYGRSLLRLCENITSSRADAEECLNDTYLAAWNRIPPERPERLFAYLARVARNQACKRVRSRARQKRAVELVELTDELAEALPSEYDISSELDEKRLAALIDGFIRGLDESTGFVFMRRYFFSDSIKELSKLTGYSQSKLKSMLSRTRKKLRELLTKEGF